MARTARLERLVADLTARVDELEAAVLDLQDVSRPARGDGSPAADRDASSGPDSDTSGDAGAKPSPAPAKATPAKAAKPGPARH
jgi:hypothetical protein